MIEIRSLGTGVESLKLSANFFSSINLTSLSALALLLRTFSALSRCWVAKVLNSFSTSRSTVEVALGAAMPSLPAGDIVRFAAADGRRGVVVFSLVLASATLLSTALLVSAALGSVGLGCSTGVSAAEVTGVLLTGGVGGFVSSSFEVDSFFVGAPLS